MRSYTLIEKKTSQTLRAHSSFTPFKQTLDKMCVVKFKTVEDTNDLIPKYSTFLARCVNRLRKTITAFQLKYTNSCRKFSHKMLEITTSVQDGSNHWHVTE